MISKSNKDTFLIVDGHALIYRAFHAFPILTSPKGEMVNALYGFLRVFLSTIKEVQPKYLAVAFDSVGPTKRKQVYEAYKANRKEMPDELKPQIPLIKEAIQKMNIPTFEMTGIEADDLIGTITKHTTQMDDVYTLILTGDKDSFQLVDNNVHIYLTQLGFAGNRKTISSVFSAQEVEEKMSVKADQIIDLKALAGDQSDNIPGVRGIGNTTAIRLLQQYGDLDSIYKTVDEGDLTKEPLLKGNVLAKLQQGREDAYLSRQLATIDREVELDFKLDCCATCVYDSAEIAAFLKNYNFNSLLKMLPADEFETGIQDGLF
ncbi:MAG: hypothetical protein LBG64_04625 [Pseudomonadales bacterium]|jgi:DNA polymerase-1|nr:hypothetical protein [Pseudomonadales bacterium]